MEYASRVNFRFAFGDLDELVSACAALPQPARLATEIVSLLYLSCRGPGDAVEGLMDLSGRLNSILSASGVSYEETVFPELIQWKVSDICSRVSEVAFGVLPGSNGADKLIHVLFDGEERIVRFEDEAIKALIVEIVVSGREAVEAGLVACLPEQDGARDMLRSAAEYLRSYHSAVLALHEDARRDPSLFDRLPPIDREFSNQIHEVNRVRGADESGPILLSEGTQARVRPLDEFVRMSTDRWTPIIACAQHLLSSEERLPTQVLEYAQMTLRHIGPYCSALRSIRRELGMDVMRTAGPAS